MVDYYKKDNSKPRNKDWNYGGSKWKLSRSKIDLFIECPRCFYLDNKCGVARPKGPSFTLNIAVDALLKKEFDLYRKAQSAHPLMNAYKVDAVPLSHKELEQWRDNFTGIQYTHEPSGMVISGAIDDVWVNPAGELIIVDYKATSKDGKMDALEDTQWQNQYKRQMEVYQWLFRKKGFTVSDTGYFVYVNGRKDKEAFDGKLEFDVTLISHTGNTDWIEGTLLKIKKCLDDERIPHYKDTCEFCCYIKKYGDAMRMNAKKTDSKDAETEEVVDIKKITEIKKVRKGKKDTEESNSMPLF